MEIIIPFSYWVFGWFILYEFGMIPYNPFWWLVIAFCVNILQLGLMVYYQNDGLYLFLFIIGNVFLKIIPIYTLFDTYYKKIHYSSELLPGLVLFSIYIFWTWFITFRGSYEKARKQIQNYHKSIQNNKPFSPFVYYISKAIRNHL
jgi:hypothetical protein